MANRNAMLGYILAILGVVCLALTSDSIRKAISLTLPSGVNALILMIIGLIFAAAGIFFVVKNPSSSSKVQDLPIYEGNNIVGFRRHKPK
jgi:hypothetical protein